VADTFAGRIHVEWDSSAPVTPFGQMPIAETAGSFFTEQGRRAGPVSALPKFHGHILLMSRLAKRDESSNKETSRAKLIGCFGVRPREIATDGAGCDVDFELFCPRLF
jgi:hypothetical protein